ncbi:tRNA (guanosine(46)-N7)-methyltransferase TrmB [Alphaproteobacteria bacterium]|nr:tRNA (guanosine(46)-N7)-methyltransferase TrmB [Alphaproteobacteria bacterium]
MAKNNLIEKQENRGFFGRRLGRRLNKSREQLIQESLNEFGIDADTPAVHAPTWMEIGFGDGHHLAGLIERYPDINFIGIEPYINGMGNFLYRIRDMEAPKVQVHMDDAIPLLHKMADGCLERLYVLNPDPWPKTRHHKRRIINQEHLDLFSRLLKPGSWLVMATDVDDLAEWMVTECSKHPDFEWTAESSEDWTIAPDWWETTTRYAQKGLDAGRRESYLIFEKKA